MTPEFRHLHEYGKTVMHTPRTLREYLECAGMLAGLVLCVGMSYVGFYWLAKMVGF